MRHNCSFVKGRFTGDPSYEYEHTETKKVEGADGEKMDGAEEENIVCKVLLLRPFLSIALCFPTVHNSMHD